MVSRRSLLTAAMVIAGCAFAGSLPAQEPAQGKVSEQAARRYPQPVRVGDLIDRRVLKPEPDQPVLGRVAGVTRDGGGALSLVVKFGGVLGIGSRLIAIPIGAVALLGEHVAVMDLKPAQLAALPTFDPASAPAVPSGDIIRVGIVRPFH